MVFLLNYLRQAVERQKVEREGRGEAQSDLLGTICIHREEELICAEDKVPTEYVIWPLIETEITSPP